MIKIIPGIYQLRLPLQAISLEYVNAYLVEGDKVISGNHVAIDMIAVEGKLV